MDVVQNISTQTVTSVGYNTGSGSNRFDRFDSSTSTVSQTGGGAFVDRVELSFFPSRQPGAQTQAPALVLYNAQGTVEQYGPRPTEKTDNPRKTGNGDSKTGFTSDEAKIPGERFNRIDRDRDGQLDMQELNQEFRRLDLNRDLMVDPWEFKPGKYNPPYIDYINNRFTVLW